MRFKLTIEVNPLQRFSKSETARTGTMPETGNRADSRFWPTHGPLAPSVAHKGRHSVGRGCLSWTPWPCSKARASATSLCARRPFPLHAASDRRLGNAGEAGQFPEPAMDNDSDLVSSCTQPARSPSTERRWQLNGKWLELDIRHYPMFSMADQLTELLTAG